MSPRRQTRLASAKGREVQGLNGMVNGKQGLHIMMSTLNHYRYIDALRGHAFLGVLTVHASQEVPSLPFSTIPEIGQYGVQLFFLLSAVTLLRSIALRSSKERFAMRNFFMRRFFRIAPLFWTGIALYGLLDGCQPRYTAPNGLGPWHFLSTLSFLHGWSLTTINSVVPGGWSIAVEMTFYLCLPLLAGWVTTLRQALLAGAGLLVTSVLLNGFLALTITKMVPPNEQYLVSPFLYFWFPSQLPVFLLGFAVYYGLHDPEVMRWIAKPSRSAVLAVGSICGLAGLTRLPVGLWIPVHVFAAVMFAIIIMVLAAHPLSLLVNRMTCGLGTLSFSCYITHFVAIRVTAHFLTSDHFAFLPPHAALFIRFIAIWMVALGLTMLASACTYLVIEKPGIKLGNFLIRSYAVEHKSNPALVLTGHSSSYSP